MGQIVEASLRLLSEDCGFQGVSACRSRHRRIRDKANAGQTSFLGHPHDFDHTAIGHRLIGTQLHFGVRSVRGDGFQ